MARMSFVTHCQQYLSLSELEPFTSIPFDADREMAACFSAQKLLKENLGLHSI